MMAEFVAKCAQESSKRCHFFPDGSSHPDPSQHEIGIVISEEFGRPMLALLQRSGRKNPDSTFLDLVKTRCIFRKLGAKAPNARDPLRLHRDLDRPRNFG